jgi:hypothetical protein
VDHLRGEVADLRDRVAALERRLDERRRGPRDQHDERWLRALAAIVGAATFTAPDIVARAALDPDFRDLLHAADVGTVSDCGYVLRRCRGSVIGHRRLVRLDRGPRGAVWRFVDDDHPAISTPCDR